MTERLAPPAAGDYRSFQGRGLLLVVGEDCKHTSRAVSAVGWIAWLDVWGLRKPPSLQFRCMLLATVVDDLCGAGVGRLDVSERRRTPATDAKVEANSHGGRRNEIHGSIHRGNQPREISDVASQRGAHRLD